MHWLLIAIGGGLGSVLRFWMQGRVQAWHPGFFPIGTLSVNFLGSVVIGFLGGCFGPASPAAGPAHLRLFLMVGILGGFTTFSSYSLENMYLLRSGQARLAALYLVASNVLGIGAAFAGFFAGRAITRYGAAP